MELVEDLLCSVGDLEEVYPRGVWGLRVGG
jgi:hypothetical protein